MGVFLAARQRVEFSSRKLTWLEAIHEAHVAKRTLMPVSFFRQVFSGKDWRDYYEPVPPEFTGSYPVYLGTFGVYTPYEGHVGSYLESRCRFGDAMKTVIIGSGLRTPETAVCICDHGFSRGKPFLQLSNEKTGRLIETDEDLGEAETVRLRLNCPTHLVACWNTHLRDIRHITFDPTTKYVYAEHFLGNLFGLLIDGVLREGGGPPYPCWNVVELHGYPEERAYVLLSADGKPLENPLPVVNLTRERADKLVINGTLAQLDAVVGFVEELNRKRD